MSYNLIGTVTVGSGGAAAIAFSSIPSSFTDLKLVLSGRSMGTFSPNADYPIVTFNGVTTATYSNRIAYYADAFGARSATNANGITTAFAMGQIPGTSQTANTFGNNEIYIANYASSTNKVAAFDEVSETNGSGDFTFGVLIGAGLWSNTAAITSINITLGTGSNWAQYSTASLYGIN